MYDIQSIYIASDISDAVNKLKEKPEAEIISGGTDVLIKIREGRMAGCDLISISEIKELKGIEMEEDGSVLIRPATVFSHITNNEIIQKHMPNLGEAVDQVGGPQIRNMGTVGGNVCNGVTSADSASTLCTLNAVMELTGPEGVRHVKISDWYTGPGKTVREHGELLTGIRIAKKDYESFGGYYIKYGKRESMEIATLGCSVMVKLSEDKKTVDELRIAYGVAGPNPMRCPNTEAAAAGKELNNELLDAVGKGVLEEVNPRSSWRASKEFRLQLVEELSKRALCEAVKRAGGEINA